MIKSLKYFMLALVLLGIFKLIQVSAFDAKKYASKKEEIKSTYLKKNNQSSKTLSSAKGNLKSKKPKAGSQGTTAKEKASDNPFLNDLKENYLKPIRNKLPADGLRKDIFIRYYRHEKDGIGVYKLEEMGYYMHQKKATETIGLGSNIIYYGDNVPLEDIQIVVLTLLDEDIPIKSINHTKFEWKSNAIEIGTDTSLLDEPIISVEEIHDFHKQYLGGN